MSSILRPSTIDDEGHLIEFLARAFSVAPDEPFLDARLMRWKYWETRSDWPGPRSFVMERDGKIVAHAGIWPVIVQADAKIETGVHMIDWAADPGSPGAGMALLQRLTRNHDFVYSIGGSAMTESVLPKFGFRTAAEAVTWARPIRPFRQILHHQSRDVRLAARLMRNIWWSRMPSRVVEAGTSAAETIAGAGETGERGELFFQYLGHCPATRTFSFDILDAGLKTGFIGLAIAGEQARVALIRLNDPSPENWRRAFCLAHAAALKHTGASELVARGATEAGAAGAELAGMRVRAKTPVFLFRKKEGGAADLRLQFQLCDNDAVFMRGRDEGFLT
jgi:hypothetical protein